MFVAYDIYSVYMYMAYNDVTQPYPKFLIFMILNGCFQTGSLGNVKKAYHRNTRPQGAVSYPLREDSNHYKVFIAWQLVFVAYPHRYWFVKTLFA